jgi:AcrR family transcriptional regulator
MTELIGTLDSQDSTQDPRAARSRQTALTAARTLLLAEGIAAVTHLRLAQTGGGARRTLYRHWPDQRSLLRDTLAYNDVPHASFAGPLGTDLVAHLRALNAALTRGHLGYVICALGERSTVDPFFEDLSQELTEQGCEPLRQRLLTAVSDRLLPKQLDMDASLAALEGPVFYHVMVRRQAIVKDGIEQVVRSFVKDPPIRNRPRPPR